MVGGGGAEVVGGGEATLANSVVQRDPGVGRELPDAESLIRASFAPEAAFPELPSSRAFRYVRAVDPLSVLIGWGERLLGGFRQTARTDLRMADQARVLRRQLAASFEDWRPGPKTDDELVNWANRAARGFRVTQPALDELVSLRPEASRRVRRVIGQARDDYYEAADLIGPTIKTTWQVKGGYAGTAPVDAAPLRRAFAHFKRCIAHLDAVAEDHD